MKLVYKPQVLRQLKKIPPPHQKRIIRKLELLSLHPLSGKPLTGQLKGLYSLRAWPYRIIYLINKKFKEIQIISIIHRQSAYK